MSDAAAEIVPALMTVLRGDPGVQTAFGPSKVRIYDIAPPASANALFPYIVMGLGEVIDQEYEQIDAGEYEAQLHVWSRPDPRTMAEAAAIAAAVKKAVSNLPQGGLALPSFRLADALPKATLYLEDTDGLSVHAVVRITYSYDPL